MRRSFTTIRKWDKLAYSILSLQELRLKYVTYLKQINHLLSKVALSSLNPVVLFYNATVWKVFWKIYIYQRERTLLNILVIRHPGALLFIYAYLQDSQDTHLEKGGGN